MVGATSGTGALGGLVGSLVGESIAATQNNIFKGSNKQYFQAVKSNMPDLDKPIYTSLRQSIKGDSFFGSRLRESSTNTFTSRVTSYGLARSGKADDGNLLLTPRIAIDLRLKDSEGKTLAGRTYIGTGYNHPITTYASNAAETSKGFKMAIQVAIDQFYAELAQKTKE
ncbi:MAG: hypothetical protein NWT08_06180 [Akkermansiaceae bacterium]|jgi:hypothetical protein|nr:hypothetical protein [Akkermansiaceae bacterium]MDP4646228.1 hypothetical protein [Akkermansiaceae bacterium]MDP4720836.1 hypothetical protein [Akkermansiaceae bacterium]MDP4780379.1 hypothetical protein [Akkermansiaceae bacterium]MDP4846710.1 hypothetical protein [Akkermansiaceae bacterium]